MEVQANVHTNTSTAILSNKTPMKMNIKSVVIGGSGLIGSKLVNNLRQRVQEVVAAAPSTGLNTITREGLAEALKGAQVVVDVANAPNPRLGSTHFAEWLRQSVARGDSARPHES